MFDRCYGKMTALARGMAYISGGCVLLLAIYMAIDVTSRRLGGPFTGVSNTVASFVIVMVGTWSLAYALAVNAHVKIDVIKNFYSTRMRAATELFAILTMLCFGSVIAWQAWQITYKSYVIGSYIPQSIISLPLYVPQALMAIGYTLLCLQAVLIAVGFLLRNEAVRRSLTN